MMSRHLQRRLDQLKAEFGRYGMHIERRPVRCVLVTDRADSLSYLSATCRDVAHALDVMRDTDRKAS